MAPLDIKSIGHGVSCYVGLLMAPKGLKKKEHERNTWPATRRTHLLGNLLQPPLVLDVTGV